MLDSPANQSTTTTHFHLIHTKQVFLGIAKSNLT